MAVSHPRPTFTPAPDDEGRVIAFSALSGCRTCRHFGAQQGTCLKIRLTRSAWAPFLTAAPARPEAAAAILRFLDRTNNQAEAAYAYRTGDAARCTARQDRADRTAAAEQQAIDAALLDALVDDPLSRDDRDALDVAAAG